MTHTHPPPRHTVPQELSWLLLGCIRGSGKGPGCVCSRRAVPLPGSDPAAGGAKGPPPGTVGAGRWCQVSFGSTLNIGTVGAERLSREPAVPETRCLWSVKKQTHLLNKSMHLVMRPKLEELQDTVK